MCSDQCRASCPEPPGPQLDVGRLGGTWCDPDNTQLLGPPTPPHRLYPPHPPTNIFSGLFPSGEQLYEPLQLPSAVAELPE
ncbi:hypothetical protein GBF38_018988 [Nibea albiflora]|uniref:Uncharacterized protein n=1 Tax=Nibea albiflora TaxID=240163 RepID=A0ACB7ENG0_NIBAL|nr:hypothetical protein GBF38_018988 [Nibea albiflora]